MANKQNDIDAVLMRLLRERLAIYTKSDGSQVISNESIKALRDEISDILVKMNTPERKKAGAYIYTAENSAAESEQRRDPDSKRGKDDSARPKGV